MQFKLIVTLASLCASSIFANDFPKEVINNMQKCRDISPVLERLSCYDNIKINNDFNIPDQSFLQNMEGEVGVVWQRAYNQERNRSEKDLQFMRVETVEPIPTVILTTPALGHVSPRPILMLSCIDNITRLQVILPKSLGKKPSLKVKLSTEKTQQQSQWFLRENGFVLEASRGLDGIKEIQYLFNANRLNIQIESEIINELLFDISQLNEIIKPLRAMCHW